MTARPVVVLHATNIDYMNNAAQITAQRLREIGVNVELATSDWGGVVTRRAVKTPPDQGGWNIFITSAGGASVGNPIALAGHAGDRREGLVRLALERAAREAARQMGRRRDAGGAEGGRARDPEERLGLRAACLVRAVALAGRLPVKNLKGVLKIPEIIPFWNIEKT